MFVHIYFLNDTMVASIWRNLWDNIKRKKNNNLPFCWYFLHVYWPFYYQKFLVQQVKVLQNFLLCSGMEEYILLP